MEHKNYFNIRWSISRILNAAHLHEVYSLIINLLFVSVYSLPSFLLPFFMASLTTLSLKSVRVDHPLRHLRFLACMRHRVSIPPVYLRMRCTTVCDRAHTGEVSLSMRLILCKIRNILSIRRTLDISSKNRCCNCDLYSGKYGSINFNETKKCLSLSMGIALNLCISMVLFRCKNNTISYYNYVERFQSCVWETGYQTGNGHLIV